MHVNVETVYRYIHMFTQKRKCKYIISYLITYNIEHTSPPTSPPLRQKAQIFSDVRQTSKDVKHQSTPLYILKLPLFSPMPPHLPPQKKTSRCQGTTANKIDQGVVLWPNVNRNMNWISPQMSLLFPKVPFFWWDR